MLLTEYWLTRQFGLLATLGFFGLVNIVTGVLLYPACHQYASPEPETHLDGAWKLAATSIFLLGIVGAIWQLFYLDTVWKIYGPYQEAFSLVLCSAIIGIGTAGFICHLSGQKTPHLLAWSAIPLIIIFMLFLNPFLTLWAEFSGTTGNAEQLYWRRIAAVISLAFPVFLSVGAFVPAAVKKFHPNFSYGKIMAIISAGNIAGLLLYSLLSRNWQKADITAVLLVAILLAALPLLSFPRKTLLRKMAAPLAAVLSVCCWFAFQQTYPYTALSAGYTLLSNKDFYHYVNKKYLQPDALKVHNYSGYGLIVYVLDSSVWSQQPHGKLG